MTDPLKATKYPAKYWNAFYKSNTTNAYKDRHWIVNEFPELLSCNETNRKVLLEVGCGVVFF